MTVRKPAIPTISMTLPNPFLKKIFDKVFLAVRLQKPKSSIYYRNFLRSNLITCMNLQHVNSTT